MSARTFTPDRVATVDGRTVTTFHLKRCCNGCGEYIGDVEDRDVDDHGNLTDVRSECEHCAPVVELEQAGCRTLQLTPGKLRPHRPRAGPRRQSSPRPTPRPSTASSQPSGCASASSPATSSPSGATGSSATPMAAHRPHRPEGG